jgi:hypothetical protein
MNTPPMLIWAEARAKSLAQIGVAESTVIKIVLESA